MSLDLRERISGCWAGKCLGGAIGMPFEGVPYRPNLTPESIRLRWTSRTTTLKCS